MIALITGQSGFVGTHLSAYLRACGDEVLPCTDRTGGPVDVTDPAAVGDAIEGRSIDVVYHLAALTQVGASFDDPVPVWRVNTEGTLNVVRAATRARARVIVVSSADAYGAAAHAGQLREDEPLAPLSPYGASKAATETLCQQAHRSRATDVVIARAFNHTGAGQPANFVVPALAARVAAAERTGEPSVAVGNLDPVRDISHVADIVAAYRLLAEHGQAGEIYNVCSGRGVSVRNVAETYLALATAPLTLTTDPELVRPVEVASLVGDNTKLRAATGWAPTHTLETTLADVLNAARATTA